MTPWQERWQQQPDDELLYVDQTLVLHRPPEEDLLQHWRALSLTLPADEDEDV